MNFITRIWNDVIKENLLAFILLTIIFTFSFNKLGSMGLSYIMNMNNDSPFFHNYTLGIFGLIMLIPAAIITLGLVMIWRKLVNIPIAQKIGSSIAITFIFLFKAVFKISKVMFLLIGWLMLVIVNAFSPGKNERYSSRRERLKREIVRDIRRGRY